MVKKKRTTKIVDALNALNKTDVYSLMLFTIYKMRDIPEYSTLSELCYILEGDNLARFLSYFGGMTIKVPSLRELRLILQALLLYQYVNLEADVILNGYKTLFENYVKLINNNGKPYYKTANGGILPIWMKLLRFLRAKNEWKSVLGGNQAGELAFPTFIGEGVIELFDANKQPSIKVDVHKESIVFKEEAMKAKTPNVGAPVAGGIAPGAPMNPAFGNAPMNPAFGSAFPDSPIANADASDLPF